MSEKEFQTLIETDGLMEAEIIKSKLESFQIPCILKFESAGRLYGITVNGLGNVEVTVPSELLEEAKKILEAE